MHLKQHKNIASDHHAHQNQTWHASMKNKTLETYEIGKILKSTCWGRGGAGWGVVWGKLV
jgi:hypothetical protein